MGGRESEGLEEEGRREESLNVWLLYYRSSKERWTTR